MTRDLKKYKYIDYQVFIPPDFKEVKIKAHYALIDDNGFLSFYDNVLEDWEDIIVASFKEWFYFHEVKEY